MPLCISNEPNYGGGVFGTSASASISVAAYVGANNKVGIVNSYGYTLDMSGDWSNKDTNTYISKYDQYFRNAAKALRNKVDWRLLAAVAFQESRFNPEAKNTDKPENTATGLFQFTKKTWLHFNSNLENRKNPEICTNVYAKYLAQHLNLHKDANSANDRIALAIQAVHDGHSTGKSWANRELVRDDKESKSYLPTIIDHYKRFCE